jgi:glutathione S-transferase
MIKIYGHPQSSAGRSYWTLEEIGLEYERISISMRDGEHKKSPFIDLNPNGKVPAIVDGDYVLWDSSAIDYYLAKKYKPELIGTTIEEEGLVTQWSYWAVTELQPPLITAFIQKVFVPEDRRDEEKIAESLEKGKKYFKVLEKILKDRSYIAIDTFSVADISIAFTLNMLSSIGYDLSEDFPVTKSWLDTQINRDSFKKVMALK